MSAEHHMRLAIALAIRSVADGGGPFGAVVVRGDRVVARAANRVVQDGDPTAHAEVNAIRAACRELGTHVLTGCELYSSCEPCPMCLGAVHWARVDRVWFACTRRDAAAVGFDDELIYLELARPLGERALPVVQLLRDEALVAFERWLEHEERQAY